MRAFCVFALLLAGASGEISGCVADADAPNTCHGDVPLGDSASLLQVKVMERAQDESEAAVLTQTAALTRRCSEGAHTGRDDCKFDAWSSWTACSNGTRTRSRTVLSLADHDGLCGCTEEAETCNVDACIMGDWSAWTSCSATCGSGMRSRSRKVLSVKDKEGTCPCLEDSETCNAAPCATTTTTTQEWVEDDTTTTTAGAFEVCGTVRDVIDTLNSPIPGAVVQIQGQGQTTTNTTGQFCFAEMAQGKVTLSATKTGYVTKEMTLNISNGMGSIDVLMTKPMKMTGWRIVLQWPKTPKTPLDLDSWTQLRKGSGGTGKTRDGCTVSYHDRHPNRNRSATCPANNIKATLDQDHCYPVGEKSTCKKRTTGSPLYKKLPGGPSLVSEPETTTLGDVVPDMQCSGDDCKIVFHVTNFWQVCTHWNKPSSYQPGQYPASYPLDCGPDQDTGTLVDSQAEVTVWHGDKWKATFKIAEGDGKRQWPGTATEEWWVFSIDVKKSTVKDCNKGGDCF